MGKLLFWDLAAAEQLYNAVFTREGWFAKFFVIGCTRVLVNYHGNNLFQMRYEDDSLHAAAGDLQYRLYTGKEYIDWNNGERGASIARKTQRIFDAYVVD